jgi:DNA-binding CsgD family transcriptional regulator
MRVDENTIYDLLGLLYDSAGSPELWPAFLGRLSGLTGGIGANIYVHEIESGLDSFAAVSNIDPKYLELYGRHYHSVNVWIQSSRPSALRSGEVSISHHHMPDAQLRKTEFYTDFLRPQDYFYGVNATVLKEESRTANLSIVRPRRAGGFAEDEAGLLKILMPHLQRALYLQRLLLRSERRQAALEATFDLLPQAAILLDHNGCATLVNRSARAILARHDGLTIDSDGRLAGGRSGETAALRGLIRSAVGAGTGRGVGAGGYLSLPRPSGGRPLLVLVTPLGGTESVFERQRPAAAVFVSDPDRQIATPEAMLTELYGLTPAEARLASLLVTGKSLGEAGEELGVSSNTVRTHLKRIFEKTETNRQGDLIRLLLTAPGTLVRG